MDRVFFGLGALFGLIGVALGAFGAHALRDSLTPADLATYETAVRYQLYHALALLATAWAFGRWGPGAVTLAGWLFVAGILVFSGSLYVLVLAGQRWMGALTPVGGICFLAAWSLLAWTSVRG